MRSKLCLLLAASLLAPASAAGAQSSATLSPLDVAHRDSERLVALGVADPLLVGQRPYSRMTIARIVQSATDRVGLLEDDATRMHAGEILARLRALVAPEPHRLDTTTTARVPHAGRLLAKIVVDLTQATGSERRILEDNGLGGIDAAVRPLPGVREGRPIVDGTTLSLETLHEAALGSALTVVAQPRAAWSRSRGEDGGAASVSLERAYARLVVANFLLQVGRDHLVWGQGRDVGLLLSSGAPALDMVLVGTELPVRLPWLFRLSGPTRFALFVARLDGAQNFPHPYLVGYKINALPSRWLELGASIYTKGGGRGGPPATFGERVTDATALIDVLFRGENDYEFSDKYAGGEARLRFAGARGVEVYVETLLNDLDFNRLRSSLTEDAAHIVGVWFPRLDRAGRVDAVLELRRTGIRHYRHHQFTSGQILRGELLGDPLGPDAQGAFLTTSWSTGPWSRVSVELAAEERRGDEYTDVTGGARTIDFERSLARPIERRGRVVIGVETARRSGAILMLLQAGLERTANWDFIDGRSRTGGLARLSVSLYPGLRRGE